MKNEHGTTSLHSAALVGNDYMVRILLGRHAQVNRIDNYGNTPLHVAAAMGQVTGEYRSALA